MQNHLLNGGRYKCVGINFCYIVSVNTDTFCLNIFRIKEQFYALNSLLCVNFYRVQHAQLNFIQSISGIWQYWPTQRFNRRILRVPDRMWWRPTHLQTYLQGGTNCIRSIRNNIHLKIFSRPLTQCQGFFTRYKYYVKKPTQSNVIR